MKNSELFRLTCRCLALDTHPEYVAEVREAFASNQVNVDSFIQFASNQFVLPAVYIKLKKANLLSFFPKQYTNHLEKVLQLNIQRNNEILVQIKEISDTLAKAGIEPIYLKGTSNLLDGLYSSPGERMIGDIDFLVKKEDFIKSAELVLNLGYENQWKSYDRFVDMKHYPRLFRKDVPADVEIHRIPVREAYSNLFNTEQFFQRKLLLSEPKNSFVPSAELRLVHTFIHSQLSNKGDTLFTPGLRDMYDAYLLTRQMGNVGQVIEQIEEKKKAEVFFGYVNYLFNHKRLCSNNSTKNTYRYMIRHRQMLDHPRIHYRFIQLHKISEQIFSKYLRRILRSFYKRKDRKFLINRLKDPDWYHRHFNYLRNMFKP